MNCRAPNGFTLIELLASTALLAVATGLIWHTWLTAHESGQLIGNQSTATDESLHILDILGRELRQASGATLSPLPSNQLAFQCVADLDGNGLAVDATGAVELGPVCTVSRDVEDVNQDGLRERQLVLVCGERVQVLTSRLEPERGGEASVDPGVWFERRGDAIAVTINTTASTRRGYASPARLDFLVRPRNP